MQPTPGSFAWKIPWTEEPGRLQFMGSQRVRHDQATKHSHPGYNKATERAAGDTGQPDPLSLRLPSALLSQAGNTCQSFPRHTKTCVCPERKLSNSPFFPLIHIEYLLYARYQSTHWGQKALKNKGSTVLKLTPQMQTLLAFERLLFLAIYSPTKRKQDLLIHTSQNKKFYLQSQLTVKAVVLGLCIPRCWLNTRITTPFMTVTQTKRLDFLYNPCMLAVS